MPMPRPNDVPVRYRDLSEIEATVRAAFRPDPVGALLRLGLAVAAIALFFAAPSLILYAVQALR